MSRHDSQLEKIKSSFGIDEFRPGQREVLEAGLDGRDVLAVMPTGSGKSLCYQGLAVERGDRGPILVVSPLIALMRDQIAGLGDLGISATDFNSAYKTEALDAKLQAIREGNYDLVYTSPEQLSKARFVNGTSEVPWGSLVVDEAHCVAKWGHDFRPEYLRIGRFARNKRRANPDGIRNIMAFTATAPQSVTTEVRDSLGLVDPFEYIVSPFRENLGYRVLRSDDFDKKMKQLVDLITKHINGPDDSAIIYCGTQEATVRTFSLLEGYLRRRFSMAFYHAGCDDEYRRRTEKDFIDNKIQIVVATNALGMGIDKPNIRLVVHYHTPSSIHDYLQQTGRAGRDGNPSTCALLHGDSGDGIQEWLNASKTPSLKYIHAIFNRVMKLAGDSTEFPTRWFKFSKEFIVKGMEALARAAHGKKQGKFEKADPSKRPMYNVSTSVNAAIDVLYQFGIMEFSGENARIVKPFTENMPEYPKIQTHLVARRHAIGTLYEHMLEYATSRKPTQQLLVDLMNKDVSLSDDQLSALVRSEAGNL